MRYFIQVSYLGTAYHGWQRQPAAPSIQQSLEEALAILLKAPTMVVGAGRTDAGVHATGQMAHFDAPDGLTGAELLPHLNGLLPPAIAVGALYQAASPALHARYDAVRRSYRYRFSLTKNPFELLTAAPLHPLPAMHLLQQTSALLLGQQNFASFCKAHGAQRSMLCHIYHAEWKLAEGFLEFTIQADRFLRGMVRAIVGTVLMVGQGKLSLEDFAAVLAAQNRTKAGPAAPAQGLFLTEVTYPPTALIRL